MRIILIGDLHFYRLRVRPWQLLSKRLLGQLNLWLNRRRKFDLARLGPLLERVEALRPELLLSTGDLTTTSLPAEFQMAHELLGPTFERQATFLVPGNHDRYTRRSARHRYLEHQFAAQTTSAWPHHRPLDPSLRLIGVDAARPTLLFAGSRLPADQLERLADLLGGISPRHRVILLSHYSPGTPPGHEPEPRLHRLGNAARLLGILAEAGHDVLFLHGHVHEPWCWRLPDAPNVVAVNAGAPLMARPPFAAGQGFWEIDTAGPGWRLTHHAPDPAGEWRSQAVAVPGEPGAAARIDSPSER